MGVGELLSWGWLFRWVSVARGVYGSGQEDLRCDFGYENERASRNVGIGFRCCSLP
jgi:hypothetical protein